MLEVNPILLIEVNGVVRCIEQLTDLNSLLVSKFDLAEIKLTKNNDIQQFVKGENRDSIALTYDSERDPAAGHVYEAIHLEAAQRCRRRLAPRKPPQAARPRSRLRMIS